MTGAMLRIENERSEVAPVCAADLPPVTPIEAVLADYRPTEPGPFLRKGADDPLPGRAKATTDANSKTGSALKTRNCP